MPLRTIFGCRQSSDGSGFAILPPVVQKAGPPLEGPATQVAQGRPALLVDSLHVRLHAGDAGERLGAPFHRAPHLAPLRVLHSHVPPEQHSLPEQVPAHGAGVPALGHVRGRVSRIVALHVEALAAHLAHVLEGQQVLGAHVHGEAEPGDEGPATLVTHLAALRPPFLGRGLCSSLRFLWVMPSTQVSTQVPPPLTAVRAMPALE